MPQMSPMWWSTLFIIFIMTYMLYIIVFYFFKSYEIKKMSFDSNKINLITWKW